MDYFSPATIYNVVTLMHIELYGRLIYNYDILHQITVNKMSTLKLLQYRHRVLILTNE